MAFFKVSFLACVAGCQDQRTVAAFFSVAPKKTSVVVMTPEGRGNKKWKGPKNMAEKA